MKISVNIPSYKRPKVKTLEYLPFARVWVSAKEIDEYKKQNPGADIIACDPKHQGNLCRIRNYILEREFANGMDVVLIIDDDFNGVYYWENRERHLVATENFILFLLKYSMIAKELGVYYWGLNVNQDKQCYREYAPFAFSSYIGGPFQCFLKGNDCFYDERLYLKEDYDMTLQQLNRHRKVFRINKYFYRCKQSEQSGGCATQRNIRVETEQFNLLQKKWGSEIVRRDIHDRSNKRKKKRRHDDYNPVIKVPIKGI